MFKVIRHKAIGHGTVHAVRADETAIKIICLRGFKVNFLPLTIAIMKIYDGYLHLVYIMVLHNIYPTFKHRSRSQDYGFNSYGGIFMTNSFLKWRQC